MTKTTAGLGPSSPRVHMPVHKPHRKTASKPFTPCREPLCHFNLRPAACLSLLAAASPAGSIALAPAGLAQAIRVPARFARLRICACKECPDKRLRLAGLAITVLHYLH